LGSEKSGSEMSENWEGKDMSWWGVSAS